MHRMICIPKSTVLVATVCITHPHYNHTTLRTTERKPLYLSFPIYNIRIHIVSPVRSTHNVCLYNIIASRVRVCYIGTHIMIYSITIVYVYILHMHRRHVVGSGCSSAPYIWDRVSLIINGYFLKKK